MTPQNNSQNYYAGKADRSYKPLPGASRGYIPYSTKGQPLLARRSKHKNPPNLIDNVMRAWQKKKRLRENSGMNWHDRKKKQPKIEVSAEQKL